MHQALAWAQYCSNVWNQPTMFASRTLTEVEQRYSQIEREFLRLVSSLHYFKLFIVGIKVQLETVHMPILPLFNKPIRNWSPRLQRWILAVQNYEFQLKHVKAHQTIALPML